MISCTLAEEYMWTCVPEAIRGRDSLFNTITHDERDGVSNHQPHDCLLNYLFKAHIKEISKLRITGLCAGNSPVTGEFPAQRASNAENVSIWWRHHDNTHTHLSLALIPASGTQVSILVATQYIRSILPVRFSLNFALLNIRLVRRDRLLPWISDATWWPIQWLLWIFRHVINMQMYLSQVIIGRVWPWIIITQVPDPKFHLHSFCNVSGKHFIYHIRVNLYKS